MVQWLRSLVVLLEDLGLNSQHPQWLTTICNTTTKGSDAFWLCWAHYAGYTQTYMLVKRSFTLKKKRINKMVISSLPCQRLSSSKNFLFGGVNLLLSLHISF